MFLRPLLKVQAGSVATLWLELVLVKDKVIRTSKKSHSKPAECVGPLTVQKKEEMQVNLLQASDLTDVNESSICKWETELLVQIALCFLVQSMQVMQE